MKIFTKVFFLLLLCLISTFVFSQTVYVNSATGNDATGDGSACNPYKTFHKGYIMVSAGGTLDLTGTFTWTDADEIGDASTSGYTISKNLTIVGSGAESTIIQAASSVYSADRRVFTVSNGYTVSLESLCIRYGYFSSDGAGVYVSGVISIENCDISYNRTTNGSGGGVEVRGKATVTNSTIHNNTAHYMGGGLNRSYYNGTGGAPTASDVLDVINCTIKDNEVTQTVAYIEGAGVFYRRGGGTVTNCTIIDNSCINVLGSSTHGLGVSSESSNVYVKNCIIANNCSNSNTWGGDIGSRETTTKIVNNGGNIIGRIGYYPGGFSVNTTTWTDANNGSSTDGTFLLQDGGSTTGTLNISSSLALNSTLNGTKTLALSVGSIAINNGLTGTNSTISVPANDQRGYSRTGNTDIGSFEYDGVNPLSNTWTGNVNSDWDDAGNWSGCSVPVGTTYAIIPSTYTNPPIVNLALGTPAVCENLNVASGAEFTIAAGMGLTVNDITNNGTITIVSS
ncbi:MAG: hypothetical protein C0596_04310 [Marinilabiliales bacterium]|nr:MAG: hypothetical protein C0596_04310 [Marinilabiliales bacterium]